MMYKSLVCAAVINCDSKELYKLYVLCEGWHSIQI